MLWLFSRLSILQYGERAGNGFSFPLNSLSVWYFVDIVVQAYCSFCPLIFKAHIWNCMHFTGHVFNLQHLQCACPRAIISLTFSCAFVDMLSYPTFSCIGNASFTVLAGHFPPSLPAASCLFAQPCLGVVMGMVDKDVGMRRLRFHSQPVQTNCSFWGGVSTDLTVARHFSCAGIDWFFLFRRLLCWSTFTLYYTWFWNRKFSFWPQQGCLRNGRKVERHANALHSESCQFGEIFTNEGKKANSWEWKLAVYKMIPPRMGTRNFLARISSTHSKFSSWFIFFTGCAPAQSSAISAFHMTHGCQMSLGAGVATHIDP